jgi:hypothetical protein
MIHVENMFGSSGVRVVNQFRIRTSNGVYLVSYDTPIAYKDNSGQIWLDTDWETWGPTTGRYRNLFLREDKKTTLSKINQGIYKLKNIEVTDD